MVCEFGTWSVIRIGVNLSACVGPGVSIKILNLRKHTRAGGGMNVVARGFVRAGTFSQALHKFSERTPAGHQDTEDAAL